MADNDAQRAFWEHLYDADDKLIEDAVLAELTDYMHLMMQASEVYCSITDGRLSKPGYWARDVLREHEEVLDKWTREAIVQALERTRTEDLGDLLDEFRD